MGPERLDGGVLPSSMSMVPLTNKQVDMMRREEYMTTSFSQERPAAGRTSTTTTPQMGYGQHGKTVDSTVWRMMIIIMMKIMMIMM